MKLKTKKSSFLSISVVILIAFASIFSGCSDDNNAVPNLNNGSLAVINGSAVKAEYYLNVDGSRFHEKALQFSNSVMYADVQPGSHDLSVTKTDNSIVARKTVMVHAKEFYSLYIAGVGAQTELVLIQDNLTAPPAGQAGVRFVNMSTAAGSMDVTVTGQSKAIGTGVPFKGSSSYTPVLAGQDLTVEFKTTGSNAVIAQSKVTLESGKVYTLWAKDDFELASSKVAVGLITNK